MSTRVIPIPRWDTGTVVVPPPEDGPGYWAGGASAVFVDGVFYVAYRLRRPVGAGRGYVNVVARSLDGVHLEPVAVLAREAFGAESLERPALVVRPDGGFRLYVSCATPGTKHWRVDALDADDPASFDPHSARQVLPGDDQWGVKDPVFLVRDRTWHMWATLHPLGDGPDEADRMESWYATSADGLAWAWHGPALQGRPGAWDSRGTRITTVLDHGDRVVAIYDGRASAAQNFEEQTGLAFGASYAEFEASDDHPAAVSPHEPGGLRYVAVVSLPAGGHRLYYEATRADGAHELRTELVRPVP